MLVRLVCKLIRELIDLVFDVTYYRKVKRIRTTKRVVFFGFKEWIVATSFEHNP